MASSSRACPPQAESWCSRLALRPNVSLIWQATQIVEPARPLDRKCEDGRCPDRTANTRNYCRARRTKHDDVLAQLKADRKSTRLNSSHLGISYAVFCLKKKKKKK